VFALVEKLVYTSGNGLYAGILDWYNSNYSYYEHGMDIGNYCWRIAPQIRRIVETLQKDQDSRQAVIAIYNNLFDQRVTKDVPCTLNLQFLIRNGRLDMIATMRSNDLLWGFSYDINQFSFIQKLIAMFLGLPTGIYVHHSNSLHIYDYTYKDFEKIIACDEYYTEEEQPDLVPNYNGIKTLTNPELRMDAFFRDCEIFWKLEGMTRFGVDTSSYNVIDKYSKKFEAADSSLFFQYTLGRVLNYNNKKSIDEKHLDKYFKNEQA